MKNVISPSPVNKIAKCLDLQRRGRERIPGLSQLLSKRPDQFAPGVWPGYFDRAQGVKVWDIDGNEYIDMSISAIGAVILGYADPDVDAAVSAAIAKGTMTSLNCPEEVELAELLCRLHPWADKVRYARGGGEAMMVAVRIARAFTRREKVAFCGYHGWTDWYLAANLGSGHELEGHLLPGLQPDGVPKGLRGTVLPFYYNQLDQLENIVARNKGELAAIVMEPIRNDPPQAGFLEGVRRLADECGAVLIFDEVSSGFRLTTGGAHLTLGVNPDIAVMAKAISNGYPMAAVIGKAEVMAAAEQTFISSTYWTDRIGPVAALATIRKHRQVDAARHLISVGGAVQEGWKRLAGETGLKVDVHGIAPMGHFAFIDPDGQMMMTLFVQEMLDRGFLASNRFYANYAHQVEHVEAYLAAARGAFTVIRAARDGGMLAQSLRGGVAKPGFHRLT